METLVETKQEATRSRRSALLMGGAALAGLALARKAEAQAAAAAVTDNDILNFALNLEYLEAQYYSLAVNGTPLAATSLTGITSLPGAATATTGAGGTVVTKPTSTKVNFVTPQLAAYAAETANDELNHVTFLRSQLGAAAVAQPNIDLFNSFNTLGQLLLGGPFDPFANETNFLLGSFIFEDVGVSAYLGAAPLISSSAVLAAALDIHAVEAYHAGAVRTQIFRTGAPATTISQAIATFRAGFDANAQADIGVGTATFPSINLVGSTIVDAPIATGRVQPRTTNQVLSVVYGGGPIGTGGAFFPNGLNASNAALR